MSLLKKIFEDMDEVDDTWLRLAGEIRTLNAYIPDLPRTVEAIKTHKTQRKHLVGAHITLKKILQLYSKLNKMDEL